jgi:hypothetical protein
MQRVCFFIYTLTYLSVTFKIMYICVIERFSQFQKFVKRGFTVLNMYIQDENTCSCMFVGSGRNFSSFDVF